MAEPANRDVLINPIKPNRLSALASGADMVSSPQATFARPRDLETSRATHLPFFRRDNLRGLPRGGVTCAL
jgi:hypothetical protein